MNDKELYSKLPYQFHRNVLEYKKRIRDHYNNCLYENDFHNERNHMIKLMNENRYNINREFDRRGQMFNVLKSINDTPKNIHHQSYLDKMEKENIKKKQEYLYNRQLANYQQRFKHFGDNMREIMDYNFNSKSDSKQQHHFGKKMVNPYEYNYRRNFNIINHKPISLPKIGRYYCNNI